MNYVLIDGNNVAIRSAFANEAMRSKNGDPTGAHYGFFNSLLSIKEKYPDYQYLIAWDGKSARRMEESRQGVSDGLIKEAYKENRKKAKRRQPLLDWFEQADFLKRGLGTTGIPQIRIQEYEADDVIASYTRKFDREGHKVVIATSDRDFYQLLSPNVKIWDGLKDREFTEEDIKEMYGVEPIQLIDVGALMGDNGDNIFGIPGWGEKIAISAIKKHGSWDKVIKELEDKHKEVIEKYPPLTTEDSTLHNKLNPAYQGGSECDDPQECYTGWAVLSDKKTPKGKNIYPEIYWGMPHSGLLTWFDEGEIKMPKKDLMALMFKERVRLAYSLKKMDDEISDLPEVNNSDQNKEKLLEYFEYYDIRNIVERADILF